MSEVDEEELGEAFPAAERRRSGMYFSPRWLVDSVLAQAAPYLPARGAVAVVDPACGAGAFLVGARARLPKAQLFGLELSAQAAELARARLPGATVLTGNALSGDALETLLSKLPPGAFEVWLGNPPYNGTSALLQDAQAYARVRALLPSAVALPKGTSLRDDFAFFLLTASKRLERRPGILAFVTSATLLDAFLYGPLREALLERLSLRSVHPLPEGTFANTRVQTCFSIWTSPKLRAVKAAWKEGAVTKPLRPVAPDFVLRPARPEAEALHAGWAEAGQPLAQLCPVQLSGLKTRFDELLVDASAEHLLARLRAFAQCAPDQLEAFRAAAGIPARHLPKLRALKAALPADFEVSAGAVRPFLRYRGAQPMGRPAFCYLDRRLIPRGDHRLQGAYDPHAGTARLVFNTRELPLHAQVLEGEGCVTAYQHARFAPLMVPRRVLDEGPMAAGRSGEPLGALVPNLSPEGSAAAQRLGGALALFRAIAAFVTSPAVQEVWAPAFGTTRALPIPLDAQLTQTEVIPF